jgi:CRP/FNR family transcriptional regulator, anaerobic regulatory protein
MTTLLKYLNSIHPLSLELIAYLEEHIQQIQLAKKEYLLKANQICTNIYFIEQGLLRCYYLKNDIEISSWFMKEGDIIISVQSFFRQQRSYEFIQAIEDCSLFYLNYANLQFIYNSFPEFNFIGRVLTEHYYQLSEERLYSLRMQRSNERYQYLNKHFPELILRVPSKYLSSYLGVSEETLSRIRSRKY